MIFATSPHQRFGGRVDMLLLLGLWLLVAAGMLYGYRVPIADLALPDPDDALRLVQVRDFLAGQAWHDFTQYRINPAGGGGQLHWSRFIDAQIAALVLLLEPLLPTREAERWAAAIYPLLLILPVLLVYSRLLAYLGDRLFVQVGLMVAASTFSFLHYFVPLRLDHHNWQLLLSLVMLWLAFGPASMARGLAAALVIAMHVEISLEGLPYLIFFGGLFALDWLRNPATAPRLRGFGLGLVFLPLLWISAWRGLDALTGVTCDSFSRPYVAGAAVTGLLLALAVSMPHWTRGLPQRLAALALAGAVGGAAFFVAGPACIDGPFGNLSPLVREYWYEGISEGMPIWKQSVTIAVSFAVPSIVGLGCLLWSARRMAHTPQAENWWRLVFVAVCSVVLSLLVLRATAVTHAYLVPGYILLTIAVFRWGRSFPTALQRIPATTAVVLATPMAVSALAIGVMMPFDPPRDDEVPTHCINPVAIARLNQIAPATFFTPLDIAPAILVSTPHSVTASGHHRNHRAMHDVIKALMASDSVAETIVRKSGATYVALCQTMPEYQNFKKKAPQGLTANLDAGRVPDWLEFVWADKAGDLRVYRVRAGAARFSAPDTAAKLP